MPQTDGELVLKIRQGDQFAFDQLFAKYQTAVYRFVRYLTQNRNEADDLFQETWLRVVKYLPCTPEIKDFKAWIFRIAINRHRDELRKRRIRRPFQSLKPLDSSVDGDDQDFQYQGVIPTTLDKTDKVDLGPAINRAISRLPIKQRRVFVLKEIEGFKHREIAEMLGLPVGTIKSLLHRAIKKLQKELSEFYYN